MMNFLRTNKGANRENTNRYDWYSESIELLRSKKYWEVIRICTNVLTDNLICGDAWFLRGVACYYLDRFDSAITCYDKSLEYKDEQSENDISVVWASKGFAFYKLKNYDKAINACRRALKFDNGNADAKKLLKKIMEPERRDESDKYVNCEMFKKNNINSNRMVITDKDIKEIEQNIETLDVNRLEECLKIMEDSSPSNPKNFVKNPV
jgi:tetratricopeptide (TPR) repeat protein